MKVSKGDPTLKRSGSVTGWNPWTPQRTIGMKLNRVVPLHTAPYSRQSGYSVKAMVPQSTTSSRIWKPRKWCPNTNSPTRRYDLVQYRTLTWTPPAVTTCPGLVSLYRGGCALFAVCIDMKSPVAPQSTNNSTMESKESPSNRERSRMFRFGSFDVDTPKCQILFRFDDTDGGV